MGVGKFVNGKSVIVDQRVMKKLARAVETVTVSGSGGKAVKKELPRFKFFKVDDNDKPVGKPISVQPERLGEGEGHAKDATLDEDDVADLDDSENVEDDEDEDEDSDEAEDEGGDAFDDDDEEPAKPAAKKAAAAPTKKVATKKAPRSR